MPRTVSMNNNSIKAIIFDLDGTLVEFKLDYKRLRSEVINLLNRQGLPISLFSTKDRIMSIVKKTERVMANRGKSKEEIKEIESAVFSIVDRYEMEAARTTQIIPGVIPTLRALKEANLKMGIFTFNGRRPTECILKRFHLEEFFDAIVSREDAPEAKPSPEHLKVVLKVLDAKPQETVVIGDSEADMECARQLGAVAVGITNTRTSINQLISAGANYIISLFTDLPVLVRNIDKYRLKG